VDIQKKVNFFIEEWVLEKEFLVNFFSIVFYFSCCSLKCRWLKSFFSKKNETMLVVQEHEA
jgi:hypothetical protein